MPSEHPQTPQSPSQNSPDTQESASYKQFNSPRTSDSLPTPAHSINGHNPSTSYDHRMETVPTEDLSNKRKRDEGDQGDREQKKVHVEDSRINIEDLHLDVGQKYLLCRTPHPAGQVPMMTDLFERYGLEEIAASVARVDENNNKKSVRKTYKNYLRGFSGQFDSVKKEDGAPDTMMFMMQLPQEEWDAKVGRAAQVENSLPAETIANLGNAMSMAKGVIPKSVWNSSILGELNTAPVTAVPKPGIPAVTKPGVGLSTPAAPPDRPIKIETPRPRRSTKKRHYGDSAYEGYGEGYIDDDFKDDEQSAGDGEDGVGSRKRPKKDTSTSLHQSQNRQGYGPGMVGA